MAISPGLIPPCLFQCREVRWSSENGVLWRDLGAWSSQGAAVNRRKHKERQKAQRPLISKEAAWVVENDRVGGEVLRWW